AGRPGFPGASDRRSWRDARSWDISEPLHALTLACPATSDSSGRRGIRSQPAQARHHVVVDECAVAEGGGAPGAFDLEAEPLVEPDRGVVVDIARDLRPPQVEPVVGGVDERSQQARADAAAVEVVVHGHGDVADVVASPLVAENSGRADDASVQRRDDSDIAL